MPAAEGFNEPISIEDINQTMLISRYQSADVKQSISSSRYQSTETNGAGQHNNSHKNPVDSEAMLHETSLSFSAVRRFFSQKFLVGSGGKGGTPTTETNPAEQRRKKKATHPSYSTYSRTLKRLDQPTASRIPSLT